MNCCVILVLGNEAGTLPEEDRDRKSEPSLRVPTVSRLRAPRLSLTAVRLQTALGQYGVRDCQQTGKRVEAGGAMLMLTLLLSVKSTTPQLQKRFY